MRRRLAPLLLAVLIACGQESAGIGQAASAVLDPMVQEVRSSAASGDRAGAVRTLAELREAVAELRRQGELSAGGATRVLAAAAEVETRLALLAPAAVPTTQIVPTRDTTRPTPTTKKPKKDDNGGNNNGGNDNGGNGNGGDDD